MTRYLHRDQNDNFVVELEFDSLTFEEIHDDRLSAPDSDVTVAIYPKTSRHEAEDSRLISLGNLSVPTAPWFRSQLLAIFGNTLVVGVAGGLTYIDLQAAEILFKITSGNTPVWQVIPDYERQRIFVLHEAFAFSDQHGRSNLATFDLCGALIWRAPLPDFNGFSSVIQFDGTNLELATWDGRCLVEAEHGSIIRCWFTKGM